jgi:hypothetical protein
MTLFAIALGVVRWAALVLGVACLSVLVATAVPMFVHGESARYSTLMGASYSVISGLIPWLVLVIVAVLDFRAERWGWFAVMVAVPTCALGVSIAVSLVARSG